MAKSKSPRGVTPPATAAFTHLHKPDTEGKFADDKFKVTLVFDKADDLTRVQTLCKEAAKEKWGKVPKNLYIPIRDGDKMKNAAGEAKEEFAGKNVITVKSKYAPTMVDSSRDELAAGTFINSGDLVKCSFGTYAYTQTDKVKDADGNIEEVKTPAISLQLRGVQLLEKRAGGGNANDFDDESDEYGTAAATPADADTDDGDDDDDY